VKNVIPAKAGIQVLNMILKLVYDLDPGLRRDDVLQTTPNFL